jgi:multiple sugar transport system substrate-binding protein
VGTRTFVKGAGRSIVVLLAVTLLASACGLGDSGSTKGATAGHVAPKIAKEPKHPVTITFSSWVGESTQMKKFKAEFEKLHPNITVEFQNVPSERATDKLTTQVAGGNPPDVAFMDSSAVGDFAPRATLVNLDGYIAGSKVIEPDDYVAGFRQASSYKGSMFALPYDGETTGLFYRTDLFQKAGISGPPKTWAELKADAAKLTDPANKTYGWIEFAPEAFYYWYPFLWQAGGDLLSPDGQHVAYDSPAGVKAANFYLGLRKYSPTDYLNSNSWDGRVAFATGKVAMYMAGSWFGGEMKASFPEINGKWDVAPLPEGPAGCATTQAGDSLAIFNASKNQDAAWMWIEFLSTKKNEKIWTYGSKTSTLLPPRQSMLSDPDLTKYNPWLKGFADQMKCAVTSNITQTKWGQIEQGPLNQNLGKAMYGDITPAEALKNAAEGGEKILSGNGG